MSYGATRDRVEDYFDRSATQVWERLTSDAPVSKVRETVRAGRAEMRDLMLSRLPQDLTGCRVLDAGCGPGVLSMALAERGAQVVGVDLSPSLISIAARRMPDALRDRVNLRTGDMLDVSLGTFDHVIAMDSLIYYGADDIAAALATWRKSISGKIVFTVAPKTPLLSVMWHVGRVFPKSDRSPTMVPHSARALTRTIDNLRDVGRVTSGFYISQCLEQVG